MWLAFGLAPGLVRAVATRTDGPSLNRALAQSGQLLAAFSVLVSVGLLLS
jgi:1,4-dihydroxy-2-naphthoate octaprenyltransferase